MATEPERTTKMSDKIEQAAEELWDKYSDYIGDSLCDFEMVSGRSVMLSGDYKAFADDIADVAKSDLQSTITRLQAENERLKGALSGWVSVEDRLPDNDWWKRVLVNGKHHILPHFYQADSKSWWAYGSSTPVHNVSHYMDFTDLATEALTPKE